MSEVTKTENKNQKKYFAFGIVIICLALAGLISLGSLAVESLKGISNEDKRKAEYEKFLAPVVMLDPELFDDVTNADMEDLLNASILSILADNESTPYDFDFVEGETSGIAIPKEIVESKFVTLFGTDVKPEHQSVECSTCVFEYQNAANRYVIPLTGYDPAYVPDVTEIDKSGEGAVALTVGYIAYGDWELSENKFTQPEPVKYRKITLRINETGYYVSAVQNSDATRVTK